MKTKFFLLALALTLAVSTATAKDSGAATAEKLERQMFDWMVAKDWASLGAHIAPHFQSLHSDGARDRAGELELIKNLHMTKAPTFTDFKVTRSGDLLIITYRAASDEVIDGKSQAGKANPHMSVWQKTSAGWVWISHANINQ
ncbi:MAG: nuclear transport factor 2 family protein [Acidobacteriota bacterium]|nr:nuclear transport factor 2 family protein [Acidobacteriota bacterium]